MVISSIEDLVAFLRDKQLIEAQHVADLVGKIAPRYRNRFDLLVELLNRGWLSQFQFEILFQESDEPLWIGPFVLLGKLGSGTMGQVYKARRTTDGRVVALKTIQDENLCDALALRRFLREIYAVSRLSHPNIVAMLDSGLEDANHFFVMEWVEGPDLATLVEQTGPLPVPSALDCVRQAALGLQHAHERGLIHRDVKPSNLLLEEETGVIKVFDLGLVRITQSVETKAMTLLTFEDDLIGTPDYVAPEQILTPLEIDHRCDIYSLGCTLYFLLTGGPPFVGSSGALKLTRQVTDDPEPVERLRSDLSPEVADVVRRLMAKKPGDRPPTMTEAAALVAAQIPEAAN
jgi:serine/threonine protein kinase